MKIKATLQIAFIIITVFLANIAHVYAQQDKKVILTISGKGISVQNLTYETLSAMGSVQFDTSTIWTDGVQNFEGIPLKTILNNLGVSEGMISAKAINDYAVEIPITELSDMAPIVAYKRNGEFMSIRDKGPLWVVYPYDSETKFQTEVVYSRSIWQLDRLEVE